uniref:Uncharacterized protein n=1 Tax=Arundo donax TaxID=35708 RepID=A0A0A9F2G1_ARUDO
MYEAPGKFLLSFASDRSSGSQCATYSPSGSYVLDWRRAFTHGYQPLRYEHYSYKHHALMVTSQYLEQWMHKTNIVEIYATCYNINTIHSGSLIFQIREFSLVNEAFKIVSL